MLCSCQTFCTAWHSVRASLQCHCEVCMPICPSPRPCVCKDTAVNVMVPQTPLLSMLAAHFVIATNSKSSLCMIISNDRHAAYPWGFSTSPVVCAVCRLKLAHCILCSLHRNIDQQLTVCCMLYQHKPKLKLLDNVCLTSCCNCLAACQVRQCTCCLTTRNFSEQAVSTGMLKRHRHCVHQIPISCTCRLCCFFTGASV